LKHIHKDMGDDCTIESSEFSYFYNSLSTRKGLPYRLQSKRKGIKNQRKFFLSFVVPTSYNNLHLECLTGNIQDVEEMLKCEDVNSNDGMENHGATPLHVALIHEKYDIAMLLLRKGAFVDAVSNNGWTPLHIASSMGCVDVVNCLLDVYKADCQSRDSRGWTPLFVSIFRGHIGVIQVLLGKETCSQDFRNVKDYYGQTMLMTACQGGHVDTVELLLSIGVHDIHARDQDGWTALNYAERKGNSRIIMHILKKYASKGVGQC
jgi:ankyrin repeat protein